MSYKKFFSNNHDKSYNDFLKIKKGREMIKKAISNKKYNLNTFINYETFLILTKTFYDNLNNRYTFAPPVSITNSNTSYINYKSILAHLHDDDCEHCKKCPVEEIVNCKYVANILYPYGESIIKNDPLENMYFPHNINLNLYCKKCPFPCVEECETFHYKSCGSCNFCKTCDRGCGNPCDKGCCGGHCDWEYGNSCNKGCCGGPCDRGYRNPCDRGCGKTKPLFFKEKDICKCSKTNSKCVKCYH
uniref:Uncharacterized protein n=1 Tax=viral metagenome TaxID=1070528 RepID=A0A6C0DFH5_9ZZZZ